MFISIRPIIKSSKSGDAKGILIIARFLRHYIISDLEHIINVSFDIKNIPLKSVIFTEEITCGIMVTNLFLSYRKNGGPEVQGHYFF